MRMRLNEENIKNVSDFVYEHKLKYYMLTWISPYTYQKLLEKDLIEFCNASSGDTNDN